MFAFPLLFILVVLGLPVFGSELSLQGNIEQGALILGKVAPGTDISVNGRRVHVDDTGVFLFGLGRDHPQTLVVEAKFTDGSTERREKIVQQRQYEEHAGSSRSSPLPYRQCLILCVNYRAESTRK